MIICEPNSRPKRSEDIFKELQLKEHSLYIVRVKSCPTNIEHEAVLFTGFSSGSFCFVYNNSYGDPVRMNDMYSIEIVEQLPSLKR